METPKIPAPKDQGEKEVLEKLVSILTQLELRKQDRSTYVRTEDVMGLYDQTNDQVKRLNELRNGKEVEENRVDRVVDSCFQLLSLFFMTIGRNNEAPAAYALTSTIIRLLDHLGEADLYTAKDLESMSYTLNHLNHIIETTDSAKSAPYLVELIAYRIERCRSTLGKLQRKIDDVAEELRPVAEKLVSILRQMALLNTKSKPFLASDVQRYRTQLVDIGAPRVDGHFVGEDGNPLQGSDKVVGLLERCQKYTDIILDRQGKFPEKWLRIYDILVSIRNELDKLTLTQAWSLRETDLYDWQRKLDKIDESRIDGNWYDESGEPAELYVQRTFLYLIRRSYGYIYHLMVSSEPVSEALLPIYNQLQTLKRCLIEVKNQGGVSSIRELYPYSMKLSSIESMRVDGKFMVGGDVPEGQGSVSELLSECLELSVDLRTTAEQSTASTPEP